MISLEENILELSMKLPNEWYFPYPVFAYCCYLCTQIQDIENTTHLVTVFVKHDSRYGALQRSITCPNIILETQKVALYMSTIDE